MVMLIMMGLVMVGWRWDSEREWCGGSEGEKKKKKKKKNKKNEKKIKKKM